MEINFINTNIRDFDETEIVVHSQKELNTIPTDIRCRINVCFGSFTEPAIVRERLMQSIWIANDNHVVVDHCASVNVSGEARVVASRCNVIAGESSRVVVRRGCLVFAYYDAVVVCPDGDCEVSAHNDSIVITPNCDNVVLSDNARASAYCIA